ncbi:MAG: FAD-dependent oxidoreductase [Myxococcales bacterium]|nr:FAD-dependent oxidoreductase [Myxococcales bacterium]
MRDVRPVVIVGAGLAGLACAGELTRRGFPVQVFESSDRPGGALRTDSRNGFRIDRGFQVLLTAYPEARRALDHSDLGLGPFRRGALVWSRGRFRRLADPTRHPLDAPASLASGLMTPRDAVRVLKMRRDVTHTSLDALFRRDATTARGWLEARGFSRNLTEQFFRPFLAGICLDPELTTSSRYLEFVMRMFATGAAALPAGGMAEIPRQLSARIPAGTIRLECPVSRAEPEGVTLESGETAEARCVVIAADAQGASRLVPDLPEPTMRRVWTLSFDAPESPVRGPWLVLDGERSGPVNHLAVPSEVAPGYAPAGRSLVCASVLEAPGAGDLEAAVREQMQRWFGNTVDRWKLLGVDHLPQAFPSRAPEEWPVATLPVRHSSGLLICGAHRETTSIGGALRSGRRAARAILGGHAGK